MDDWCVTRNASWAQVRSYMLKTGCTFCEVPVFVDRMSDFAIQETLNYLRATTPQRSQSPRHP